jgi:hypothetical protein
VQSLEALAASIKLARAGLREPEKPIGCYLFSGPTGVGKTEVARQLAATLGGGFGHVGGTGIGGHDQDHIAEIDFARPQSHRDALQQIQDIPA